MTRKATQVCILLGAATCALATLAVLSRDRSGPRPVAFSTPAHRARGVTPQPPQKSFSQRRVNEIVRPSPRGHSPDGSADASASETLHSLEPARQSAEPRASADRRAASPTDAVTEADARVSLQAVGIDPLAEDIWYRAINDSGLSPDQRRNLIEDLNEDGFPDPKHPAPEDLPLIVRRLQLIEAVAGDSPDEVNYGAFMEAYKDLVKMYAQAQAAP